MLKELSNMKKLCRSLAALALAVICLGVLPARADSEVEEIFAKVNSLNPGLVDYQAALNLDVHAKWAFIPYNPKLAGHYYYKQPDKHKLVLEEAPSFIKDQPSAFGFHLPSLQKYNATVTGTSKLNGREVYEITLLPKQQNSITSMQLWVDCENYTVPRQITNYKDNGKLTVNATYTTIEDYWVFERMYCEFSFPKVKVQATATATYSNYKFNQGIPDSFFEKKK